MLSMLGEIYLSEGVEQGKIAYKIAEKTGMSYPWVARYLPDKFKDFVQSERRTGAVIRRITSEDPKRRVSFKLEEPPKDAVAIKAYGKTNFVNIMLEINFYKQLEETAKKVETPPDKLEKSFYEKFERDSLELGASTEISRLKSPGRLPRKDEEGTSTQEAGKQKFSLRTLQKE
jgi:hypothetical protein